MKNKSGTSSDWAAKMRRNILAHGLIPSATLFLLALPDHFYLWKNVGMISGEIPPTYDINPEPFLKPYYDRIGISPEGLSGISFELIVFSWLNELKLTDTIPSHLPRKLQDWLFESGFFEAIQDGQIESEKI
ncbi:hypothetical protein QUF76_02345 [Desulfobacterales bacterium HSG16]|nr:hypothetical protein [Desulfobacterales bacterium HSG16]